MVIFPNRVENKEYLKPPPRFCKEWNHFWQAKMDSPCDIDSPNIEFCKISLFSIQSVHLLWFQCHHLPYAQINIPNWFESRGPKDFVESSATSLRPTMKMQKTKTSCLSSRSVPLSFSNWLGWPHLKIYWKIREHSSNRDEWLMKNNDKTFTTYFQDNNQTSNVCIHYHLENKYETWTWGPHATGVFQTENYHVQVPCWFLGECIYIYKYIYI